MRAEWRLIAEELEERSLAARLVDHDLTRHERLAA
jgi:hypothetical protein